MNHSSLPIILLLTIILSSSLRAEDCDVPAPVLTQLSEKFGVDNREACKIIDVITIQVTEAQNYIIQIGDSNIKYNEKTRSGGLIDTTIEKHYINEDATIQVTSLNNNNGPKDYYIKAYLQHLADLSYKGIYNQVKLVFYPNDMKLLEDNKNPNQLVFQVFQDFIGCRTVDGEKCYKDVTDKRFYVSVTNIQSSKREIKIQAVAAVAVYDYDKFHAQNGPYQNNK